MIEPFNFITVLFKSLLKNSWINPRAKLKSRGIIKYKTFIYLINLIIMRL